MTIEPSKSAAHLLPRLYVAARLAVGQAAPLTDDQAHYLRHVLRRDDGSMLRIFHPQHGEFLAKLVHEGKKAAHCVPQSVQRPAASVIRRRHLLFSPLKKDKMDMLVEKAVELGVTDLHPVLFQRSIVREVKPERITAQVIEAAEQCERLDIPALHPLIDLRSKMQRWDTAIPVYAAIERGDYPLLGAVATNTISRDCGFLVGPEGGITPEEITTLLNIKSIVPISLGPRILRAETAALYGLSVLQPSDVHETGKG